MESENIDTINQFLIDQFGIHTASGLPMYRVVWAEDQYEKRETKYTDSGIELLRPEVRELPKYQWLKGVYVLEYLCAVPLINVKELAGKKIDYNILHAFFDRYGQPIPPACWACQFVIDTVRAAMSKESLHKYVAPTDPNAPITSEGENEEHNRARLNQIQNELFGNESGLNQETVNASGSAIIVPSSYKQ